MDRTGARRGAPAWIGLHAVHEAMVSRHAALDDERGAVDHARPAHGCVSRPALLDRLGAGMADLEIRVADAPIPPHSRRAPVDEHAEAKCEEPGP